MPLDPANEKRPVDELFPRYSDGVFTGGNQHNDRYKKRRPRPRGAGYHDAFRFGGGCRFRCMPPSASVQEGDPGRGLRPPDRDRAVKNNDPL